MNLILEQYKISFSKPISWGGMRSVSSINDSLSQWVQDHYTITEAGRILTGINTIIANNDLSNRGFQTPTLMMAIINSDQSKIYNDMDAFDDNENIIPNYVLPTPDLKVIVEEWRRYLEQ